MTDISPQVHQELTTKAVQILYLTDEIDTLKKQLEPYRKQEKEMASQSVELKEKLKATLAQKQMILDGCKQLMQEHTVNELNLNDPNNPNAPLGTMKLAHRGKPKEPKFSYYDLEDMIRAFQEKTNNQMAQKDIDELMSFVFWECLEMTDDAPTSLLVKRSVAKPGTNPTAARKRFYNSLKQ